MIRPLAAALITLSSTALAGEGEWETLFNGVDLEGWTVKIGGHAAGDNFAGTFRVEEGLLKVRYDKYPKDNQGRPLLGKRYGHLFWNEELSHYRLRVEYRFVGEQTVDGPAWAERNSGVMLHGERPEAMPIDQPYPTSLEAQLLGGLGKGTGNRPTGNLCTPGTDVVLNGELTRRHCINSSSKTYHGDQWVVAEVEVRGGEVIRHSINGEPVLEYSRPTLSDPAPGQPEELTRGTVSLQSESHPIDFRRVELMRLDAGGR